MRAKRKAWCLLRPSPYYRRDAFVQGLQRAGFSVVERDCFSAEPGDVVVIWNRQHAHEQLAQRVEASGATVLVAENGYLGQDANHKQLYALAVGGHNGSGLTPTPPDTQRFEALGVDVAPWRTGGVGVLVCCQRGIGSKLMASPRDWPQWAKRTVKSWGEHPILRAHPGNIQNKHRAHPSLVQQLMKVDSVLIWTSRCGIDALLHGVPVRYSAPHWVCSRAASFATPEKTPLIRDDDLRLAALSRAAWAQWSVAEIETGEPIVRLMELGR